MDLKTTWPKLLFAGTVALVPAVLSYCKSSQEADRARIEADAGYKALVQSVKHLELVVTSQSATIDLLSRRGSASWSSGIEKPLALPDAVPPHFPALPDSTAAALQQQDAGGEGL